MTEPQDDFEIECPHCKKINATPRPTGWACQNCNKPLGSGRYARKIISASTALLLGIGGTYGVTNYFDEKRYSIGLEHAIIEDCISSSEQPMASSDVLKKRQICICSLERTQNDFGSDAVEDLRTNRNFWAAFGENAKACIADAN